MFLGKANPVAGWLTAVHARLYEQIDSIEQKKAFCCFYYMFDKALAYCSGFRPSRKFLHR